MIPIDLYGTIKNLEIKPPSFENFCEEMHDLFNIENADKFFYEYLTNDNKYYPLDKYNYSNFYQNEKIKKIIIRSSPDEIYSYSQEDNIYINKDEEEENENPNFYEENIIISEEKDVNKDIINPDIVKQKIINEHKEKMRKTKSLNEEKEKENGNIYEEDEEIILNNKEDINKINIISEKEINENNNNNIDKKLNDIINKNFDELKNDLINESNIQLSQIVMESKIKNSENEELEDDIETPLSVENHTGYVCDGCNNSIIGIRYKCVICPDFDYCEKCEEKNGIVHDHPFYQLRFKIN